ncbi:MAG TPA: glycosyltransferase family 2 protein [Gemmata sp.]
MNRPKLSIIVPVYNEERHLRAVLERLAVGPYPPDEQEVIVVDDGSSDRTPGILAEWGPRPGFVIRTHPVNRGKGAAVRTGLGLATGAVAVVQDADLECDPADIPAVVGPIFRGSFLAVFGSRYLRPGSLPWSRFRVAVSLLNGLVRVLYGVRLTDVNCCYKAARTELFRDLDLRCERFEFCAEVAAKLCRGGVRVGEVPVRYTPRTRAEGKKIGWRDAVQFGATLIRWRFRAVPDLRAFGAVPPEPVRLGEPLASQGK